MVRTRIRAARGRGAVVICCGAIALALAGGCGDQDGDTAGTLPAYDSHGRPTRALTPPDGPRNLVVIVVDALRADVLPLDVGIRPDPSALPMPYLSTLADGGVSFANAAAAAPWTLPSMTSLLTGLQPSAHGLNTQSSDRNLLPAIPTFAEVLSAAYGYETAAFVDGPWFGGAGESILQGFEHRETEFSLQAVGERVKPWAAKRDSSRPFFLLLHTFDAHDPYGPENHPWPTQGNRVEFPSSALLRPDANPAALFRACYLNAALRQGLSRARSDDLGPILQGYSWSGWANEKRPKRAQRLARELGTAYWSGVRWVDGLLERTVATLEALGLLDETLLVVAGDHGEAFGEHGMLSHGRQLYDELVRVPLVMKGPEPFQGGTIVQGDIGLVDVIPTYMEWAGLVPLDTGEGRSALGLLYGLDWCRPVVSEEVLDIDNTGEPRRAIRISARTGRWKYIITYERTTGRVQEEAYDLLFDPEERSDLGAGSGRLPVEVLFDPCICPAIEAARSRIWNRAPEVDHLTSPPPAPCGSKGS